MSLGVSISGNKYLLSLFSKKKGRIGQVHHYFRLIHPKKAKMAKIERIKA
jgi:hypothetical protein